MDTQYRSPWQCEPSDHLKSIVSAGEELLHHAADQAGEDYRRARVKFEGLLANGKQAIADAEATAVEKARLAAARTDQYVHMHPWQSMGYGAAAAAAIGVLAGVLIGRR